MTNLNGDEALNEKVAIKQDTSKAVLQKMAEFKRELRTMSKNDLIRSFCAQYAQTVMYAHKLEQANLQIEQLKSKESKDV
jgi:hypothetical protein